VFDVAIATLDSGLALVNTRTDADSKQVLYALLVTKARAQLGVNKVAEAGATVASVPSSFSYNHTFAASSGDNAIWGQPNSARRYNVGNNLEGNDRSIPVANNLPFFSAGDPRVPAKYTVSQNLKDTTKSQDGLTFSRTTSLYGQETSIAIANYLDAQLIIAEAKLKANDAPGMFAILNALRAAPPKLGDVQPAAMTPLVDPVTPDARLDLLFREKAFWTFSRGQRLGDLRRLIRFYSRTPANTFPTGGPIGGGNFAEHYRGGAYGPDVNLPVPQQEENNPNFHGCTDRNA
jgi:starch-binding outer membrane protein, SusD/RagB family